MRAFLVSAYAAATAQSSSSFDYSSYQKQYSASSSGNSTGDYQKQYSASSGNSTGDWKKYAGAHANYAAADTRMSNDWHKYTNASTRGSSSDSYYADSGKASPDSNTYSGPFQSDTSILKLKGNVTALKAKKAEVENLMDKVKSYVPEKYQTAPLGQYKKDLSDIRHMLKEAEAKKEDEKKEEKKKEEKKKDDEKEEKKGETKDQQSEKLDEAVTPGTAFLANTDLQFSPLEKKVGDLKDKIKDVKNRKEDIDRYVPKEYQTHALKDWKKKVDSLEAELKAAEGDMQDLKKEKEEDQNETKGAAKDEKNEDTSDETVTTLVESTDLASDPLEKDVDDLKHKITHVKDRKHDIYKYVPKEYQTNALKHWKRKVERLEAELKKAEDEMKELKEDKKEKEEDKAKKDKKEKEEDKAKKDKKEKEEDKAKKSTGSNATASKGVSDMMAALVASKRPTGPDVDTYFGSVSVGFWATVSLISLAAISVAVALRRRSVNVDQQPLLG